MESKAIEAGVVGYWEFQFLKDKVKQRQIVLSNILYTKCDPMSSKN